MVINIKEKIKSLIKQALQELGFADFDNMPEFTIEHPGSMAHGDYASNVAMVLAKATKTNPKDLAEKIVEALKRVLPLAKGEAGGGLIEKIEVAGAGFNNFEFSNLYKNEKILVEHSSPNLFKSFHIGHVMNNTIGESITRLARASGAEVAVISYPSDLSLGIAKAVYILLEDGIEKLNTFKTDNEKLNYLGDCYVRGTKAYDDEVVQVRVRQIVKILYESTPGPEMEAYKIGNEINLNYFKNIVMRLGTHFDNYIFESEAGVEGKEIVLQNTPNIFTKSDGAIIYEGEKEGLHTRVFINSDGFPTYEAKDIGLLSLKFKRYNPNLSIFITDHEQTNYFEVVVNAGGKINPIWQNKTVHRTHGRMR